MVTVESASPNVGILGYHYWEDGEYPLGQTIASGKSKTPPCPCKERRDKDGVPATRPFCGGCRLGRAQLN